MPTTAGIRIKNLLPTLASCQREKEQFYTMTEPASKESRLRSLIKGITWRILATATTMIIAYIITGEVGDAIKIGAIEFVGKLLIYYLHERAWQMVPRGTIRRMLNFKG